MTSADFAKRPLRLRCGLKVSDEAGAVWASDGLGVEPPASPAERTLQLLSPLMLAVE